MIDPVTFIDVPSFGDDSTQVEPGLVLYDQGFSPEDRLPAQYLNWFLHGLTNNDVAGQDALNAVITELDNLVVGGGEAVSGVDPNQVLKAVKTFALDPHTSAISNTWDAFQFDTFLHFTAAGPTTQDITAGATREGINVRLYNDGTGAATITFAPGKSHFIGKESNLLVVWDGTDWNLVEVLAALVTPSIAISSFPYTVSPDQAVGLFKLTTGASNQSLILPAASVDEWEATFVKQDSAAGTLTVSCAGADTLLNGATSISLYSKGDMVTLKSDGVSTWYVKAYKGVQQSTATGTLTIAEMPASRQIVLNNGGALVLDISAGAFDIGTELGITELNNNGVTIQTGGASQTALLGVGSVSLRWNGTAWEKTGGNRIVRVFTGNGTMVTPWVGAYKMIAVGPGGGGGGCRSTAPNFGAGGGGAGGGMAESTLSENAGVTITAVVPAGGTAGVGANPPTNGGTAANTTLSDGTATLVGTAGGGGVAATNQDGDGGASAVGSGGQINIEGQGGAAGVSDNFGANGGMGGSSPLGGGARSRHSNVTVVGEAGGNYGGGASGGGAVANNVASGGVGGHGIAIVEF